MCLELSGKQALVTGSNAGIKLACATGLAQASATIGTALCIEGNIVEGIA
ncbi:MAG: hypothetical protein L0J54_11510 [Halomonas sp.]|nr:hypothetical protein [Halomonas sp.]MDN6298622.1 hypothetical protein [Halomonas sp.]MDN6336869.1 hypothetical protein [Halomonas sp.]